MAKYVIDGIEIEESSGNVYADLGIPNAEQHKIKADLVIEITRALQRLRLSQQEAGDLMGIPQARVSRMLRGDFANISERKLMDCLNRLGYDIVITAKPASGVVGHLSFAVA